MCSEIVEANTGAHRFGDIDLHLFAEGNHQYIWKLLGAHPGTCMGKVGCFFAVWAPGVQAVNVVGDFNSWSDSNPMSAIEQSGIWSVFIPGLNSGCAYKYSIHTRHGDWIQKADPYGQQMFLRPETTSCIADSTPYPWTDHDWLSEREQFDWLHSPVSIYELHVGSWRLHSDGRYYTWRELATSLIPYIKKLNYTHIELLPISEHPLDASWGYQVSGYYAPTARFGSPEDLRYFIDQCHQANIGVFLDWVPAHFPKDDWALAQFIGEPLYEYADTRKGEHLGWGTLIFDYGRNEVKNFLLANALYWISEFHIDGLRVDAVAAMLHLDYAREPDQWVSNALGGRENLEAVEFIKQLNSLVHANHPGVLTMAEESTAWPGVSRPVELGGLGFSMKWNMGWMNDNLRYIETDPIYRKHKHNHLTFSQMYAWSENFILPLSHDEVVHLKRSMLDKMPGNYEDKFSNLRLFYAWQYAHPGKKLLFMGGEFGQWTEWSEARELDWSLTSFPIHDSVSRFISDLNTAYRQHPALHALDFNPEGFSWIDCNDIEQSVVAFCRFDQEANFVIAIFNFTPVTRRDYRIGAPRSGHYLEFINSDSELYNGSNIGNNGQVQSEPIAHLGYTQSLVLTLPPLGALFLQFQPPS